MHPWRSVHSHQVALVERDAHPWRRRAARALLRWGFDPRLTVSSLKGALWFRTDLRRYRNMHKERASEFPLISRFPITTDRRAQSGTASGHYFHQDLLVASEIERIRPRNHIDIGSRVDGFVAHVASFMPISVIDVRPLTSSHPNITFQLGDISNSASLDGLMADSISCLHALEHVGLGRYGDELNYDGWRLGLDNLFGLLEQDGLLYVSVPTGREQGVEFNAHRIFRLPFFRDELALRGQIIELSFVDDDGNLHRSCDPYSQSAEESFGARYGLSIWTVENSS